MTRDASTPDRPAADTPTMVLRLSVPAGDEFRDVVADVAVRIAEYVGIPAEVAASTGETVQALAADVTAQSSAGDTTFEFHQIDDELRIDATCADRSSSATHPLPT